MMEQTFVLVKPDGVARGLTGEIIRRIEQRGLKIVALKMTRIQKDFAKQHYTDDIVQRKGENVYNWLIDYITEGPVVAMIVQGVDAIENVRKLVGSTESKIAIPGTIRGDFSHMSYKYADGKEKVLKNLVHASSDENDAKRELYLWFSLDQIFDYRLSGEEYLY